MKEEAGIRKVIRLVKADEKKGLRKKVRPIDIRKEMLRYGLR